MADAAVRAGPGRDRRLRRPPSGQSVLPVRQALAHPDRLPQRLRRRARTRTVAVRHLAAVRTPPGAAARRLAHPRGSGGCVVSARQPDGGHRHLDRPFHLSAADGRPQHPHRSAIQRACLTGELAGAAPLRAAGVERRYPAAHRCGPGVAQPLRSPRYGHRPPSGGAGGRSAPFHRPARIARLASPAGRRRRGRARLVGVGAHPGPAQRRGAVSRARRGNGDDAGDGGGRRRRRFGRKRLSRPGTALERPQPGRP